MGILCSKIDVLEVLLAEERRADTFGLQIDFEVDTVVNNDVEFVLELLYFISVANNVYYFFFVRLENTVSLHHFPDGLLVLGEGCVLCINFGFVGDSDFLCVISKHLDIAVIDILTVNSDYWADRVCVQLD